MKRPPVFKHPKQPRPNLEVMITALEGVKENLSMTPIHQYYSGICGKLRGIGAGYLRDYIDHELGDHAYIYDWVRQKTGRMPSHHQIRQIRMNWLDWMIASLKKDLKKQTKKRNQ